MGEATGDAEEGDDFAIQGKLRQQRQRGECGDVVPTTAMPCCLCCPAGKHDVPAKGGSLLRHELEIILCSETALSTCKDLL